MPGPSAVTLAGIRALPAWPRLRTLRTVQTPEKRQFSEALGK